MKTQTFPLYRIATSDLYSENSDSELKIPNIQRGLVWKAQQMELLWDSILREFPIGAMLALKNEDHYDILDGQQRANAIITGFNVNNILNKEKPPTSILWIDLSFNQAESNSEFRKYGIRLTNSSHPWGFEEDGGKLSAGKRRAALRTAYGENYPEFKRDWDIRRFVPFAFYEKESFLPVPLAFLVNAARDKRIDNPDDIENFWSAFAKSLDGFSKFSAQWERRYHSRVSDFITSNKNNKDFIEPFFKLNEYEVIFNYVDCVEEIEVLFNRINKQGTAISNSELTYSAIKHYGADICDCPEIGKVIKREANGLMLEHNLAQILFRYCFSIQRIGGVIEAKTVRKFKALADHLDETKDDEYRIISELRACFAQGGYLHDLLDVSKKILLSSVDGCNLPSLLYAEIAENDPELILLLLKLTQKHRGTLEENSSGFIQALIFYLYCFSDNKAPVFSIFKAANTSNFNKETVINILRDAISMGACIPLVSSFRNFPALDEKNFFKFWSKESYSDCRGYLAFRRLFDYGTKQSLFMLKFAQRHYYQRYFGDYNPSVKELWDEINRPWDHDHIIPQNWTAEGDWKNVHSAWINSIGNIADIPFEQNRGKGDDADWHYYLDVMKEQQDDDILFFDKRIIELDEKALRRGIETEMKKFMTLTRDRFLKISDEFLSIFDILELDRGLSPMQQERKDFFMAMVADNRKGYKPYYLEQSGKEYLIENVDDDYCWQRPWVSAMDKTGDDPLWQKSITIFINSENSSFLIERGFRKRASLDLSVTNNQWWKPGTYKYFKIRSIVKNVMFVHGLMAELDSLEGYPSGFHSLDRIIGGFRPSQLTVIASGHGVGKTTFALNIAKHVAADCNIPTAVFSLQSSSHSVTIRLMAATCNMDMDTIAEELKKENEDASFHQKLEELQKAPLWIDDTSSMTVTEFRTKAEKIVKDKCVKLIIVDFMQLIVGPEEGKTTQEQDTAVVKCLKETAEELNVSIIGLSMLRIKIWQNHSRPSVSDLPCVSIEENSDVIMLIDYQGDNVYESDTRIVSVAKNANGQTGEVPFRYLSDSFNFIEP